jgi:hypothetical protein
MPIGAAVRGMGANLVSTAELAQTFGYKGNPRFASVYAKRFIQRHGIGVKIGDRWFTTADKLRTVVNREAWDLLFATDFGPFDPESSRV